MYVFGKVSIADGWVAITYKYYLALSKYSEEEEEGALSDILDNVYACCCC